MKQDDHRYLYASDDETTEDSEPAQDTGPSEQNRQTVVRGLPAEGNGPSPRDASPPDTGQRMPLAP